MSGHKVWTNGCHWTSCLLLYIYFIQAAGHRNEKHKLFPAQVLKWSVLRTLIYNYLQWLNMHEMKQTSINLAPRATNSSLVSCCDKKCKSIYISFNYSPSSLSIPYALHYTKVDCHFFLELHLLQCSQPIICLTMGGPSARWPWAPARALLGDRTLAIKPLVWFSKKLSSYEFRSYLV